MQSHAVWREEDAQSEACAWWGGDEADSAACLALLSSRLDACVQTSRLTLLRLAPPAGGAADTGAPVAVRGASMEMHDTAACVASVRAVGAVAVGNDAGDVILVRHLPALDDGAAPDAAHDMLEPSLIIAAHDAPVSAVCDLSAPPLGAAGSGGGGGGGAHIATASWDSAVHVWDVARSSAPLRSFRRHVGRVLSAAVHPAGMSSSTDMVVTGAEDCRVCVWDVRAAASQPATCIAVSCAASAVTPTGAHTLAVGTLAGDVCTYDVRKLRAVAAGSSASGSAASMRRVMHEPLQHAAPHAAAVRSLLLLHLSPHDEHGVLVSAGDDATIRCHALPLHDARDGVVAQFCEPSRAHSDHIHCLVRGASSAHKEDGFLSVAWDGALYRHTLGARA